jgi:AcrR family transcriptional regulator
MNTKDKIIASALKHFLIDGFENTSMRVVAVMQT